MQTKLRLSYSRLSTLLHCRQQYYWKYIENLIPRGPATVALKVGGLLHELRDQWIKGTLDLTMLSDVEKFTQWVRSQYPDAEPGDVEATAYDTLRLFNVYMDKMRDVNHVASETHLEWDDGEKVWYTRLDGLIRLPDTSLWREETKSAGRMDSAYLSGLKGGLQAGMAYIIMKEVMPEEVKGTLYTICVKTKVATCEKMLVPRERLLVDMTMRTVQGAYDDIVHERWAPSMQCFFYNRQCDYLALCKGGTEQLKRDFYTTRKDVLLEKKDDVQTD